MSLQSEIRHEVLSLDEVQGDPQKEKKTSTHSWQDFDLHQKKQFQCSSKEAQVETYWGNHGD